MRPSAGIEVVVHRQRNRSEGDAEHHGGGEFCRALLDAGYVYRATLTTRLSAAAALDLAMIGYVEDMIRA